MEAVSEKYSFMVDVSGSTGGSENYWNTVGLIFNLYAKDIDKYYEWDSEITEVTKKQMEYQIEHKLGKNGTSPEVCANEIIAKKIKRVILITDGQVGDHSVQECDKVLQNFEFSKTICYIIASSNYGALNMSVTCPFTRKCQNEVWEKKFTEPLRKLVQYTPEDYKILDELDEITLDNFETNYDKIEGLIIALNMGKEGNIPLKNQLVVMKKRLVQELSKKKGKADINKVMRTSLEKGDFQTAIEVAQTMTTEYFSDSKATDLENNISHLINLCGDLRGKYDLGQIKSNKMATANDAKEGELDQNVEATDLSKHLIECPIILDEDIPQILVDECSPIFVGIEKCIVDDITACPLRLLNYPEVKAKVKARLSNYMGVKYADKFLKNPFTQKKLLGAIPLGSHKSHVKVGNFTIAKMFSDGKILGNLNMFYAAIWYIIKEKEIEYLKDIEANATEHLIYRLKKSNTMASLCGLPKFVTNYINTDLAVWYCVNSGFFNQPTDRDTFRFHLYNMHILIDIVKALGYPIEKGVELHLARTKSILSTLSCFKKLSAAQKLNFKEAIRCLYQNSIEVNEANVRKEISKEETVVKFIPIDGKANKKQIDRVLALLPKELQKLPINEIVHIGELINAEKSAADIFIDYNFKPYPFPEALITWEYGTKEEKELSIEKENEIDPKTLRPKSTEHVEKKNQISGKKLFKGRKHLEEFILKYKFIPTIEELQIFYYNRYVVSEKVKTLPYLTEIWSNTVLEKFTKVLEENNISIKKALKIFEKSRSGEICHV